MLKPAIGSAFSQTSDDGEKALGLGCGLMHWLTANRKGRGYYNSQRHARLEGNIITEGELEGSQIQHSEEEHL